MSVARSFADELKACMADTGYSLDRLAQESGVAKSTIHHWTSGRVLKPYGWENLLKVAKTMNLSKRRVNILLRSAQHKTIERIAAGPIHPLQRELVSFWLPPRR